MDDQKCQNIDIIYTCSCCKKKQLPTPQKNPDSFAANKAFIKWWLWGQAYFWGQRIIITNPEYPSSILQYHKTWFSIILCEFLINM